MKARYLPSGLSLALALLYLIVHRTFVTKVEEYVWHLALGRICAGSISADQPISHRHAAAAALLSRAGSLRPAPPPAPPDDHDEDDGQVFYLEKRRRVLHINTIRSKNTHIILISVVSRSSKCSWVHHEPPPPPPPR